MTFVVLHCGCVHAPDVARVPAGTPPDDGEPADPVPEAEARDTVSSSFGSIELGGLLQVWYFTGTDAVNQTFRIRRTELRMTGDIMSEVHWTVMVDPAKLLVLSTEVGLVDDSSVVRDTEPIQATRILQDTYVTAEFGSVLKLDLGQRKVPLSLEGLQSSAALKTIERALFLSARARGGDLGDVRDIGAMVYGSPADRFDFQLGIFNGLGENQNTLNSNEALAVAARMVARPIADTLQIGLSGGWNGGVDDLSRRLPFRPRYRLGGELFFRHRRLTLQSEVMTGEDGDTTRLGAYALVAYHFTPRLEGVLQLDTWDPDRSDGDSAATASELDYLLGLNYYIRDNHLKVQVNAVLETFANAGPPSRAVLVINVQTAW